jgi:tRNA threonylcarbamoyladenosine modification (KEOPS) complex Cgi121 subunit
VNEKIKSFPLLILIIIVSLLVHQASRLSQYKSENVELRIELDSLKATIEEMKSERIAIVYVPKTAYFCNTPIPLENHWVRKRFVDWLKYYTTTSAGRRRIDLYLRETEGTFTYVERRLLEKGMPEDIKYIPVIESELDDEAKSRAGAVGRWQFMKSAGAEMGLVINKSIDERKHFEKATEAALKKLASEYEIFKDWPLTFAAYNAGVSSVKEALKSQPTAGGSYFDLVFYKRDGSENRETMDYFYRSAVIKFILENPELYGFERRPYEGIKVELKEYKLKKERKVVELAKEFNIPPAQFRELNPWINRATLPKGVYRFRLPLLPRDTSATFGY